MTEFMKLLRKVEKTDFDALLWGVKILVKEFTSIFVSKTKHANFSGFMSIILNLSSFLHLCKQHCGPSFYDSKISNLEELRFLKQATLKIFDNQTTSSKKKISSISQYTKSQDYSLLN